MPQHASQTCNESNGQWLPLIEYSVRSGLSLSTIRRRIKSNSLQYRLEQGRYLILFEEPNRVTTSVPAPTPQPVVTAPPPPPVVLRAANWEENVRKETPRPVIKNANGSEVDSAVKMISDAFEHAIREKDERIHLLEKENLALEERLNELRLLVKVLEEKYEVRY
jgi:hypothetical protein